MRRESSEVERGRRHVVDGSHWDLAAGLAFEWVLPVALVRSLAPVRHPTKLGFSLRHGFTTKWDGTTPECKLCERSVLDVACPRFRARLGETFEREILTGNRVRRCPTCLDVVDKTVASLKVEAMEASPELEPSEAPAPVPPETTETRLHKPCDHECPDERYVLDVDRDEIQRQLADGRYPNPLPTVELMTARVRHLTHADVDYHPDDEREVVGRDALAHAESDPSCVVPGCGTQPVREHYHVFCSEHGRYPRPDG